MVVESKDHLDAHASVGIVIVIVIIALLSWVDGCIFV